MEALNSNVCFSGGAIGADTLWGELATQAGHEVIHFGFEGMNTTHKIVKVGPKSLLAADPYVSEAAKVMKRNYPSKSVYVNNLLRRNYYQIVSSDSVYAISNIKDGQVTGGTGWATTMFTQLRQGPCYVYDQTTSAWFMFTLDRTYVRCDVPPSPLGKWTGIGSRDLRDNGRQAARELFNGV